MTHEPLESLAIARGIESSSGIEIGHREGKQAIANRRDRLFFGKMHRHVPRSCLVERDDMKPCSDVSKLLCFRSVHHLCDDIMNLSTEEEIKEHALTHLL